VFSWKRIYLWVLRRFGRLDKIQSALSETNGKYLDASTYARILGVSESKARRVLQEGERRGLFKRAYLFVSSESPMPLVIDDSELDTNVRLSDFGYIGDDDDREIFLSKFNAREIYIAPETD